MNYKDESIDHHLRATWQAVAKMYNEEAHKFESTMATGFALLNIDQLNGTPSTALGPQMGMEATSLSRILKSLEGKNLIFREKNPDDGRSVLIKLTDFGREKREISKNIVIQFNKKIKEQITDEQLRNFFEVTKKINQLISEKLIYNSK
jgi:DNA-binding MarR family transcriptional regulator